MDTQHLAEFTHQIGITFAPLLLILLVIPVVVAILTIIFQTLWNTTMIRIFKLPMITFWEAFRLLLIAWFLIGGLSLHH